MREVARAVASERKVDESLTTGIAAVGLMTLQQVGLAEFRRTPGEVSIDRAHLKRTPEEILRERAKDDGQGLFGFLRTSDRKWTVVWDENEDDRRFKAVDKQEVASGAANDKRPWHEQDERCTVDEGPIPVQCRSASCGTCWVGVLGGAEKLSEADWRERKMMPLFGYIDTEEPRPLIRLSCQARAEGRGLRRHPALERLLRQVPQASTRAAKRRGRGERERGRRGLIHVEDEMMQTQ